MTSLLHIQDNKYINLSNINFDTISFIEKNDLLSIVIIPKGRSRIEFNNINIKAKSLILNYLIQNNYVFFQEPIKTRYKIFKLVDLIFISFEDNNSIIIKNSSYNLFKFEEQDYFDLIKNTIESKKIKSD